MSRLPDFLDWFLSFALLAGAILVIWICAVMISEQNHLIDNDADIEQDWSDMREAFRYNWERLKQHRRK